MRSPFLRLEKSSSPQLGQSLLHPLLRACLLHCYPVPTLAASDRVASLMRQLDDATRARAVFEAHFTASGRKLAETAAELKVGRRREETAELRRCKLLRPVPAAVNGDGAGCCSGRRSR
jgi:hypothetical protein